MGVSTGSIRLQLLGPPLLLHDGHSVRLPYQKATALLAYLATQTHPCTRERLCTLLWEESEEQRAAANLRHAVHTLRSALGEVIVVEADLVSLDRNKLWLDLDFIKHASDNGDLEEVLDLRRGMFCEGLLVRDSAGFDDWLSAQREEWDNVYLTHVMSLAETRADEGDVDGAMEATRAALATDRLHEPAHALLVRLLMERGDTASAARHLEECHRLFMDELGMPPSAETMALMSQAAQADTATTPRATADIDTVPAMLEAFARAQHVSPQKQQELIDAIVSWREGQPAPSSRERIVGPVPVTIVDHFEGRAAELEQLRQALADANIRMVSICGRGGIGKTALVARCLHEVGPDVDAILYATVRAPEFRSLDPIVELICRVLTPDMAAAARASWQGREPLWSKLDYLLRHCLGRHRTLLVLDNFEDLLDESGRVREPFADVERFIESLLLSAQTEGSVGLCRTEIVLERGLEPEEAVRVLRSLDANGALGLQTANDAALRRLAEHCHGIPRTLESLVGTLRQRRSLTLERLLEDESTLLRITENPARELFASLSHEARLVMQALAVFERPVPATGVQYMLPGLPVDDLLDALVGTHAVYFDRRMFHLHPLDRQYAYRSLPGGDETYGARALHERAAGFYRALTRPRDAWQSISDLEPQLFEFQHLVRAGQADGACDVLNDIDAEFLFRWGHAPLLVVMRSRLAERLTDDVAIEKNQGFLGIALATIGDSEEAVAHLRRAVASARKRQDDAARARWLGWLGKALGACGELREAAGHLEEAAALARRCGDTQLQSLWVGHLGGTYIAMGSMERAAEYAEEALDIARSRNDAWLAGLWTGYRGIALALRGQFGEATRHFEAALESARAENDRGLEAEWLCYLGNASFNRGDLDAAQRHLENAVAVARDIQRRRYECFALDGLGEVACLREDFNEALRCYQEARRAAEQARDRLVVVHPLRGLGYTHHLQGHLDEAEQLYREGLALGLALTDYRFEVKLALLAMARDAAAGREAMQRALAACERAVETMPELFWARYHVALCRLALGDNKAALAAYREAMRACGESGVRRRALQMLRLLPATIKTEPVEKLLRP
jgi:DNA-binding SARP family transcriptional activator/tetratricopeptide (TPR) repeat protein